MTTHPKTAILLVMTALMAPAARAQPDPERCEHRNTVNLSDPASGTLEVKSGAGAVEITGAPGSTTFQVNATLCAASRELLDGLAVSLQGGRLNTTYPERGSGWGFWRNNYASIHLAVRVPGDTAIDLEDGSGSVTISDVGATRVRDGSGSLRLRGTGPVRVEDRSGSVRISEARGEVSVEDGSGGLTIEGVTGDVRVDDGSGNLMIREITGSVTLEDGSGEAEIRRVSGNVVVTDDGSGGIEIEEVGGEVRVSDAGSGRVRVRDVEGGLTVTGVRRSRIDHHDIRGEVDLPPDRRRGRR